MGQVLMNFHVSILPEVYEIPGRTAHAEPKIILAVKGISIPFRHGFNSHTMNIGRTPPVWLQPRDCSFTPPDEQVHQRSYPASPRVKEPRLPISQNQNTQVANRK